VRVALILAGTIFAATAILLAASPFRSAGRQPVAPMGR